MESLRGFIFTLYKKSDRNIMLIIRILGALILCTMPTSKFRNEKCLM
jgi:hypothetical protein